MRWAGPGRLEGGRTSHSHSPGSAELKLWRLLYTEGGSKKIWPRRQQQWQQECVLVSHGSRIPGSYLGVVSRPLSAVSVVRPVRPKPLGSSFVGSTSLWSVAGWCRSRLAWCRRTRCCAVLLPPMLLRLILGRGCCCCCCFGSQTPLLPLIAFI